MWATVGLHSNLRVRNVRDFRSPQAAQRVPCARTHMEQSSEHPLAFLFRSPSFWFMPLGLIPLALRRNSLVVVVLAVCVAPHLVAVCPRPGAHRSVSERRRASSVDAGRSGPESGPRLPKPSPNPGPNWPRSDPVALGHIGQESAEFGPGRPGSTRDGQIGADFGRNRASFGQLWPEVGGSAKSGRSLANSGPTSGRG